MCVCRLCAFKCLCDSHVKASRTQDRQLPEPAGKPRQRRVQDDSPEKAAAPISPKSEGAAGLFLWVGGKELVNAVSRGKKPYYLVHIPTMVA